MRLVWIFTFFGTIAGGICSTIDHPLDLRWLLSATEKPHTEKQKLERIVCDTQQCKELAKTLIESMNHTVDPCEDFYEYACGNWKQHNPLPEGETRWNILVKSQKRVEERLKVLVEEEPHANDLHATKIAKRAFKACMDLDEMQRVGLQPLISTLWRAGGWPLLMEENEWDEDVYNWQNVDDYYARLIGKNSLHNVYVDVDYWRNNEIYLSVSTPHILPSMYKLLNTNELEKVSIDDEENGEGSQERGSEERGDRNDPDDQEDKDEEEYKLRRKRVARRKINNRIMHRKGTNNRVAATRKHGNEKKMKERTKRATIKSKVHNRRQRKGRKIDHNPQRRITEKLSSNSRRNEASQTDSTKKSTKVQSARNNEMNSNANNDLYFDDNDYEERNDNNDVNEEENNSDNYSDENDDKNDKNNDENFSGSGDTEWPDEDPSGSGDHERNDEDGSGSGDYEWDDEDSSDNCDDSNDSNESGNDSNSNESGGNSSSNGSGDSGSSNESGESSEKKRKEVEENRKKYAEYILNVSIALSEARGVPVSRERLAKDIVDLIEFQIKILESVFMYGDKTNITLGSLQKSYNALKPATCNGKINWIKKVQDVFSHGGMKISKNTYVYVSSFDYIKALRELLDRTPSRTIVNYVHWNFLSRVIQTTTKEMRKLYYDWDETEIKETQRTRNCVEEIEAKYILGYEYVKRYLPEKILQTASDMIDDIQKEVEYEIKKSPWMDAQIRDIVLDKLVYMEKMIGYPKSYSNTTILKEHFKGLSVTKSHYENTLSIMRYMKWQNLKRFFTKELPQDMDMNPLVVNAYFSPFENSIAITAADFQKPLYDSNQPWYTNYGIIGLVMGHEVNHGFDDSGRWFDKAGGPADWPLEMQEEYDKRLKCFTDQFTRYSIVENKTANIAIEDYGEQTAGENIADTMGLKAVFKAYERRQRECDRPDPMLPGLEDLSNEQLFFLSFANLWCEIADPDELPSMLQHDPHSPGHLRVIGSVSNSEDFAKAYNCPLDSPMNPKEKCSIWK